MLISEKHGVKDVSFYTTFICRIYQHQKPVNITENPIISPLKTMPYKVIRLSIKILFLLFLALALLGKYGYIFPQEYLTRKWIWYILGLLSIVVIVCRKDFIEFIKRDKKDTTNRKEILLSFGLFFIFANLWTLVSPLLTAQDEVYFVKNNYSRFEEIARIRTFLFRNNPAISTITFSYTGKLFDWETRDSLDNTIGFNKDLGEQSDLAISTIRTFANDLEIRYIYLSKDTISFHFNGYNTYFLSRTNQKNIGVHYVWGNYFMEEVKKD